MHVNDCVFSAYEIGRGTEARDGHDMIAIYSGGTPVIAVSWLGWCRWRGTNHKFYQFFSSLIISSCGCSVTAASNNHITYNTAERPKRNHFHYSSSSSSSSNQHQFWRTTKPKPTIKSNTLGIFVRLAIRFALALFEGLSTKCYLA